MQYKTFKGGIHPLAREKGGKTASKDVSTKEFISDTVIIPMSMHIGAPSKPCVNKGDYVKVGQVIGEPQGGLGLPVHASVSGTVISIDQKSLLSPGQVTCITIQNDFKDEWVETKPLGSTIEEIDPKEIIPAIKNAGIAGMGGASFPTHIKLSVREGQHCDTIIANGCECETFLTADNRLMIEEPEKVVNGLLIVLKAMNVTRGVIAIESNKPEAIKKIKNAAKSTNIEVVVLKTKYPQGGEKQLIQVITGKEVPTGKLPIDANTIVLNVGTCKAIRDAIFEGRPLIDRITTVTGIVNNPGNLKVRIGTILADMVGECGGYSGEVGKIVSGGGMTGLSCPNEDIPVLKATSGFVIYPTAKSISLAEEPCIRCGRCVEACPLRLDPYLLKNLCDAGKIEEAKLNNIMDCCFCGTCSYVCPSKRWITVSIKNTREIMKKEAKK